MRRTGGILWRGLRYYRVNMHVPRDILVSLLDSYINWCGHGLCITWAGNSGMKNWFSLLVSGVDGISTVGSFSGRMG